MTTAERTFSADEIDQRLASSLGAWSRDGGTIVRTYRTQSWKGTTMLAAAIAHLAELAWHHPELVLNYASVTVRLNTHSAAGVTEKDFALAEKIEALCTWDPRAENSPLEGTPNTDEHRYLVR